MSNADTRQLIFAHTDVMLQQVPSEAAPPSFVVQGVLAAVAKYARASGLTDDNLRHHFDECLRAMKTHEREDTTGFAFVSAALLIEKVK